MLQELAPNRDRAEIAWLPWRRRACPSATLDKRAYSVVRGLYSHNRTDSHHDIADSSDLRRALAVHDHRRELADSARSTKSAGTASCGVSRSRSASSSRTRSTLTRREEVGRRLVRRCALARTARSAGRPPRESGAPEPSTPSARSVAPPCSARRRRPSRNTAGRPARPSRRTLPWNPIVAM